MLDKEEFLKKYHIQDKFYSLEKKSPNLWNDLCEIYDSFNKPQKQNCLDSTLHGFIKEFNCFEHIHSIRYRIKNPESLICKIIDKKFSNTGNKYLNINKNNYYKILTDIIGIRIIIRYKYQWENIHQQVWDKFHKGNNLYIDDLEKDYISKPDEAFIAEKPIVYYRKTERKKDYEIYGLETFNIISSAIGYSSIHYIINYDGDYIELQVRTIFDEAWSECDHDFVYKLPPSPEKYVLKRSSALLSDITGTADNMSKFMSDYYYGKIYEEDKIKDTSPEKQNIIPVYKRKPININKISDINNMF